MGRPRKSLKTKERITLKATPVSEIVDDETTLQGLAPKYDATTDTLTMNLTTRLQSALEIRREMGKVYNLMRTGKVPLGVAWRMVNMLAQVMKAKTDVDKIKALNKFADEARPFSGLMVTGPTKVVDADK